MVHHAPNKEIIKMRHAFEEKYVEEKEDKYFRRQREKKMNAL
jgi:hypothetical protein